MTSYICCSPQSYICKTLNVLEVTFICLFFKKRVLSLIKACWLFRALMILKLHKGHRDIRLQLWIFKIQWFGQDNVQFS